MKVFVSYASEQRAIVEPIAAAIRERGHSVFFDRSDLPEGSSYHDRIAAAVTAADALVFAVSPESVQEKRYTLTELLYAERKWPSPGGRVLPVIVAETPIDDLPAYLKSVNLLHPRGNLAAETAFALDRMRASLPNKLRDGVRSLAAPAAFAVTFIAGLYVGAFVLNDGLKSAPTYADRAMKEYVEKSPESPAELIDFIKRWGTKAPAGRNARAALAEREADLYTACKGPRMTAAAARLPLEFPKFNHTLEGASEKACKEIVATFKGAPALVNPSVYSISGERVRSFDAERADVASWLTSARHVIKELGANTSQLDAQLKRAAGLTGGAAITAQALEKMARSEMVALVEKTNVTVRGVIKRAPLDNVKKLLAARSGSLHSGIERLLNDIG
ncbi:MAG: toll/interleukin-1 receptor domain-containing protein [Neomegalonema sp.]|nr:toll/interleukin-1 receptor domain-containing protein [Neomegalonema sp.]